MNGLDGCPTRRTEHVLDDEVAFGRRSRADMDRLVRERHVQGVAIGVGKDRHGTDAEPSATWR